MDTSNLIIDSEHPKIGYRDNISANIQILDTETTYHIKTGRNSMKIWKKQYPPTYHHPGVKR